MPRYFFDLLRDDADVARDISGRDLPDEDAARIEALEVWKRLRADWSGGGEDPTAWHVAILDEKGHELARLPFVEEPLSS